MATAALAQYRAGRLRPGINAMKRAYPQYLAAGGESLPADVLRVLFPLDYWPLLEALAKAQGLDPYLIAALAAQESTFDAGIRSSAGRHRPDADHAGHRPRIRAPDGHQAVLDRPAHRARGQRVDRHHSTSPS